MKLTTKKQQCEYWEIVECTTKGNRPTMEDASVLLYPFKSSCSMFLGVFDGHGGVNCSNYLSNILPSEIQKLTKLSKALLPSEEMMQKVFYSTDQQWLELAKNKSLEDGSTALCLALDGSDIIVANCGDSRAILYQGGRIIPLTRDHIPEDNEEKQRITKLGGSVIGGRLQGKLGVSRAFGNCEFKEAKYLVSDPEIKEVNVESDAQFLVLGCDGLYEKFTNDEIVCFIKNKMASKPLEEVIKELVDEALDRGTDDNITVIVVKFKKAYKKLLKKNKKNLNKSQKFLSSKVISLKTSGKIKVRPSEPIFISEPNGKPKNKDNPLRVAGRHPIPHGGQSSPPKDTSPIFPIGILQLDKKYQPNPPKTQHSPPKSARDCIIMDITEEKNIIRSHGFKKTVQFFNLSWK